MQREYPDRPIVTVAVALRDGERMLIVRRKNQPRRGMWVLPGGAIELGETVHQAAVRELREECGAEIKPLRFLGVEDRIFPDKESRVQYHYVLIVLLAKYKGGGITASSDIDAAEWVREEDLPRYDIPDEVLRILHRAFHEPL
ncbi:MAG: NUDIX hydrolase [Chloroflexi bacterium]|nr:NUDIX hydrolase [Chloroflexota bacterium]